MYEPPESYEILRKQAVGLYKIAKRQEETIETQKKRIEQLEYLVREMECRT